MKYIVHSDLDLEKVRLHLGSLSLEKPVEITIKEWEQNRTNAQNRTIHKFFNLMSQHWFLSTGELYTPESFKLYLKKLFLGYDVVKTFDGTEEICIKKTSKCSVKEMSEFIEKIYFWAQTELDLSLPKTEDYFLAIGFYK